MPGMRFLKNLISATDKHVQGYNDAFDILLQKFHDKAMGDILLVVHRIWEAQGSTFWIGLDTPFLIDIIHNAVEALDLNQYSFGNK